MKHACLLVVLGIIGGLSTAQAADLQVAGGNHQILNQPNQAIDLYVTGGAESLGFLLAVQIGDGVAGPIVTGIDKQPGIFADSYMDPPLLLDRVAYTTFTVEMGDDPVIAEGLLVRLILDATAVPEGSYSLELTDIFISSYAAAFSSSMLDDMAVSIPTTFLPGTITVVPEPAMASLMSLVGVAMLPRRRRR